jgi:hypothetical protein
MVRLAFGLAGGRADQQYIRALQSAFYLRELSQAQLLLQAHK